MRNWSTSIRRRQLALQRLRQKGNWGLFLKVFLFAALVPALARLKLTRLESLLEPSRTTPPVGALQMDRIVDCVEAALKIGSPVVRGGCLTRGLTLYYFLRRASIDVALCFGTGHVKGQFAGHCWLSREGEPFLESCDPRPVFAKIYSIPRLKRPINA